MMATPIVDVFAGPGGLAEGFSSLEINGRRPFRIALSIEKDEKAHRTLLLRGFYRQFVGDLPAEYWRYLRGEIGQAELYDRFPREHAAAQRECVRHELGVETDLVTRELVRNALKGHSGPWGLIGGPPCQAYSLAGRSRNRGVDGYVPEEDERQTLYVEYLQILADHRPSFFVMENVKGLLSAKLESEQLFQRILNDLADPAAALKREGRRYARGGPRYEIFPVSRPRSGLFGPAANDVIVRAEEHGIPQARHRVILLGVLTGTSIEGLAPLISRPISTVSSAIFDLPRLRSGITDLEDTPRSWRVFVGDMRRRPWAKSADSDIRAVISDAAASLMHQELSRGDEYLRSRRARSRSLGGFLNHATRAHIGADLERYFFAACFAKARKRSPVLSEFPRDILPLHRNLGPIGVQNDFNDRFRVQIADRPSTTITSHISKDGHYYIHPDPTQCRSLTVREAARLQTFPDDYFFCGPRTSQYHQVGNAVPPELARQIAEAIQGLV